VLAFGISKTPAEASQAEEDCLEEKEAAEATKKAEEDGLEKEAAEAVKKAEEDRLEKEAAEAMKKAEEDRLEKEAAEALKKAEEDRLQTEAAEATKKAEEEKVQAAEEAKKLRGKEASSKAAEAAGTRKLDEAKKAKLQAMFDSIDEDKSGYLDAKELGTVLKSLSAEISDAQIDALFKSVDLDNDDKVNIAEFETFAVLAFGFEAEEAEKLAVPDVSKTKDAISQASGNRKLDERQRAELQSSFDLIDADKSGFLDAKELKIVLQALSAEIDDEEVQRIFKSCDLNGDEKLSIDEFEGLAVLAFGISKTPAEASGVTQTWICLKRSLETVTTDLSSDGEMAEMLKSLSLEELASVKLNLSSLTPPPGSGPDMQRVAEALALFAKIEHAAAEAAKASALAAEALGASLPKEKDEEPQEVSNTEASQAEEDCLEEKEAAEATKAEGENAQKADALSAAPASGTQPTQSSNEAVQPAAPAAPSAPPGLEWMFLSGKELEAHHAAAMKQAADALLSFGGGAKLTAENGKLDEASRAKLQDTFQAIDDDKSGYIDKSELGAALQAMDVFMSDADIDKLYKSADENSDGSIDIDEFETFVILALGL